MVFRKKLTPLKRHVYWGLRVCALGVALSLVGLGAWAISTTMDTDLATVGALHASTVDHMEQDDLNALVAQGDPEAAFLEAFVHGKGLFEGTFNALDGVGAHVGEGKRFTRFPRADLLGPGEWATHIPSRVTGPNASSCIFCHSLPATGGAGGITANNVRDPFHSANLEFFITRQPFHLFGLGAKQRLAEEMTAALQAQRDAARQRTQDTLEIVEVELEAKGVGFGTLIVFPQGNFDSSLVVGVQIDLVVRPLEWKGTTTSSREFARGAMHNELGMQAVELVGAGVDGDGDGVVGELSVGDITALAVFQAALPRPATRLELAALGLVDLAEDEISQIERGQAVFAEVGCAACHVPSLRLDDPVFSEPSQHPSYRDGTLPNGVDPQTPVRFDLTDLARLTDTNALALPDGTLLGDLEKGPDFSAVVRLYSDLKYHEMGPGLAEPIDEGGTGESVWMTRELWGVGSTAPYLHDGRATTLTEAILAHGGEAAGALAAFEAVPVADQGALLAFLNNLVLFRQDGPLDADGDGVPDRDDLCPEFAGDPQVDGC